MKAKKQKELIGWSEYVDFPEWGIHNLEAKVDTGARTSALHVENLKDLGHNRVEFDIVLGKRDNFRHVTLRADVKKWGNVRSSTGVYKKRCFIKAKVRIGHIEKEIDITLTSREKMVFRMLLGRKALAGDFIVDVTKRSHLSGPEKKTPIVKKVKKPE